MLLKFQNPLWLDYSSAHRFTWVSHSFFHLSPHPLPRCHARSMCWLPLPLPPLCSPNYLGFGRGWCLLVCFRFLIRFCLFTTETTVHACYDSYFSVLICCSPCCNCTLHVLKQSFSFPVLLSKPSVVVVF
jgi:hypothetical protein